MRAISKPLLSLLNVSITYQCYCLQDNFNILNHLILFGTVRFHIERQINIFSVSVPACPSSDSVCEILTSGLIGATAIRPVLCPILWVVTFARAAVFIAV